MAKVKEYAYYTKGNQLSLVEKAQRVANGLNYVYDPVDGVELPSGSGSWKSPQSDITNGLKIGFASTDISAIVDESDTLPVDEFLCKAVVDYVKGRLAEDMGEIELKEYHMKEFHRKIARFEDTRIVGPRSVVPGIKW